MSSHHPASRVRFADRLLAEAVAAAERREGRARRDASAEDAARSAPADFEQRIITRASHLPDSDQYTDAINHVRRVAGLVVAVALVLGALAGAAAGKAALANPREPVNFFLVLLGLLGVQSVLLVTWFIVFVVGPRLLRRGSVGGVLIRLAQHAARRFLPRQQHLSAIEATARIFTRGRYGAWLFSSISHQFWAMFNIGCLVMVVVLLSTNQFTFVWETTTRTTEQFVTLTRGIASLPDMLGFITPDESQIRESRLMDDQSVAASIRISEAWSGLLVGCMVTYGLLPRIGLALVCGMGGLLVRRRYRLDLAAPEFAVLRPILLPAGTPLPRTLHDDESQPEPEGAPFHKSAQSAATDSRPAGSPAILGLEIDRPTCAWPPAVHGVAWNDLGFVDSSEDRRRVFESLHSSHTVPRALVVVCDLPAAPDRGVRSFLLDLQRTVTSPITVVLTGGQRLRDRASDSDAVSLRIDDWNRLLRAIGLADHIVELDLDHLTDRSIAQLRTAILAQDGNAAALSASGAARLHDAFEKIAQHASQWEGSPDEQARLQLHRDIAHVYRETRGIDRWSGVPALGRALAEVRGGRPIGESLRAGATEAIGLLPGRLKAQPRWLAAGAAAGAFGCLALALTVTPAAIGSLPAWAALGATVTGAIRMSMPEAPDNARAAEAVAGAADTAIRAAAIFAVVLDLQGRPEAAITRVLDATFSDDADAATLADEQSLRAWLSEVAAKYHRASDREAAG